MCAHERVCACAVSRFESAPSGKKNICSCVCFKCGANDFGGQGEWNENTMERSLKADGARQWNKYLKEQLKSRRPEEPQTTGQSRSEWNGERWKNTNTHIEKYKTTEQTYRMCSCKTNLKDYRAAQKSFNLSTLYDWLTTMSKEFGHVRSKIK